jgi:alpha-N-arabinofuranosidase
MFGRVRSFVMNHIKINPERIIGAIDRNIFGGTMEIGYSDSRYDYLNIGDSPSADKNGLRGDVREALERINLANIRFPGGNFASGYRWQDGVGPRQERPTRYDLAFRCIVPNQYGTNEFVRFCRAMNIEPYLTVNCGDADMREASDWVEYCNGTGETAPVKLRREHGFDKPHNVKYWGIGNEVDSPGQIGYKTPQEYARAITEFSKVMKRVDPDIKLVASGVCRWEDSPLGSQFLSRPTEWVERTQLMLEQAGDRIDYISIHRYTYPHEDDLFEDYMAFAADLDERLSAFEGLIRAVSLERGIRHDIGIAVDEWFAMRLPARLSGDAPVNIAADEWGVMRLTESKRVNPFRRDWQKGINLEAALATALYLNTYVRHANSVRIANFCAPMPMSLGLEGRYHDSPVLLPTIFYPFELFSRTCGQLALDVFWYGDTFSGAFKNRTYNGIRTLDVTATLDNDRKQLTVFVINQSKAKVMETTITLTTGQFTGNAQVSVVNGPDIKAENTLEKPNEVGVRRTVIKAAGNSLTYAFEPHSVTALVCSIS